MKINHNESRDPDGDLIFVTCLAGAIILTYLFSLTVIKSAYLQRGYIAYGGEYILIIVFFLAAFKLLRLKWRR